MSLCVGDVGRGGKRENIVTQIDTSKSLVTILLRGYHSGMKSMVDLTL